MSYSYSENSIIKVEGYLAGLVELKPGAFVVFEALDSIKLAYLLRQAFAAAEALKHPVYGEFKRTLKVYSEATSVRIVSHAVGKPVVVTGSQHLTFIPPKTLLEAAPIIIANKQAGTLSFPNLVLTPDDLERLGNLCAIHNLRVTHATTTGTKLERI
jgi:hypothetical protein